jgi:hypothetical protein
MYLRVALVLTEGLGKVLEAVTKSSESDLEKEKINKLNEHYGKLIDYLAYIKEIGKEYIDQKPIIKKSELPHFKDKLNNKKLNK